MVRPVVVVPPVLWVLALVAVATVAECVVVALRVVVSRDVECVALVRRLLSHATEYTPWGYRAHLLVSLPVATLLTAVRRHSEQLTGSGCLEFKGSLQHLF